MGFHSMIFGNGMCLLVYDKLKSLLIIEINANIRDVGAKKRYILNLVFIYLLYLPPCYSQLCLI